VRRTPERRRDVARTIALAKKLARYPVNGRRRSLRDVAAALMTTGHMTRRGTMEGLTYAKAAERVGSTAEEMKDPDDLPF
jgi:hypothetical protein